MAERKEVKEEAVNPIEDTGEEEKPEQELSRDGISMQHFMDDMQLIGNQVRDGKLRKPNFDYGQTSITNYLLWLMYAELVMLNNKINKVK